MKKRHVALAISLSLITLLSLPASVAIEAFWGAPVFDESYFGALSPMVKKLDNTKGKKIIIVGNSSVSFGINSSLLNQELKASGLDYSVVNFGLYGSIGTKTMMELSKKRIKEGDIVLFAPEMMEGTMSTYFSGESYLRACDGHMELLSETPEDEREKVVSCFYDFAKSKASFHRRGEKADSKDVYMLSSFDENMDLTQYERKSNIMQNGYDLNNTIDFANFKISDEFVSLVHSYVQYVVNQKAEIYFAFGPMNEKCTLNVSDENLAKTRDYIQKTLQMKAINSPYSSIIDYRYFYDTNFHTNDAGMIYNTLEYATAIKNHFKKTNPLINTYPEPPAIEEEEVGEGDNTYLSCFTYEEDGDYYKINGLTPEGMKQKKIILPYSYEGKRIYTFAPETFQNSTEIQEITLQNNITFLYDYSFQNSSINHIYLRQTNPTKITLGYHLMDDSKANIFVKKESITAYLSNYSWSYYGKYIQSY